MDHKMVYFLEGERKVLKLMLNDKTSRILLDRGLITIEDDFNGEASPTINDIEKVIEVISSSEINILSKYSEEEEIVLKMIRKTRMGIFSIIDKTLYDGEMFYVIERDRQSLGGGRYLVNKNFTIPFCKDLSKLKTLDMALDEIFKIESGFRRIKGTYLIYKKRKYREAIPLERASYNIYRFKDAKGFVHHSSYVRLSDKNSNINIIDGKIQISENEYALRNNLILKGKCLEFNSGWIVESGIIIERDEVLFEINKPCVINKTVGEKIKYSFKYVNIKMEAEKNVNIEKLESIEILSNGEYVKTRKTSIRHMSKALCKSCHVTGNAIKYLFADEKFKDLCTVHSLEFGDIDIVENGYMINVELYEK